MDVTSPGKTPSNNSLYDFFDEGFKQKCGSNEITNIAAGDKLSSRFPKSPTYLPIQVNTTEEESEDGYSTAYSSDYDTAEESIQRNESPVDADTFAECINHIDQNCIAIGRNTTDTEQYKLTAYNHDMNAHVTTVTMSSKTTYQSPLIIGGLRSRNGTPVACNTEQDLKSNSDASMGHSSDTVELVVESECGHGGKSSTNMQQNILANNRIVKERSRDSIDVEEQTVSNISIDQSHNADDHNVEIPRNAATHTGILWHMEGDGVNPFPGTTQSQNEEYEEEYEFDDYNEHQDEEGEENEKENKVDNDEDDGRKTEGGNESKVKNHQNGVKEERNETYEKVVADDDANESPKEESVIGKHKEIQAAKVFAMQTLDFIVKGEELVENMRGLHLALVSDEKVNAGSQKGKNSPVKTNISFHTESKNNSSKEIIKQEFERRIPKTVYKNEKAPIPMYETMHPNKFKHNNDVLSNVSKPHVAIAHSRGSDSHNEAVVKVQHVQSENSMDNMAGSESRADISEIESRYSECESGSQMRYLSSDSITGSQYESNAGASSNMSASYSGQSSALKLPKIDTSVPVQLTSQAKYTKSSDDSRSGHGRKTKLLQAKANLVAERLRQKKTPDVLIVETPPNEFTNPRPLAEIPRVPVPLKAHALLRDGQLEVSVFDERKSLPPAENMHVKITLVHKHIRENKKQMPASAKWKAPRSAHNRGPPDLDIVKHRAMHPPFNTHINDEASRRHIQYYGLK